MAFEKEIKEYEELRQKYQTSIKYVVIFIFIYEWQSVRVYQKSNKCGLKAQCSP